MKYTKSTFIILNIYLKIIYLNILSFLTNMYHTITIPFDHIFELYHTKWEWYELSYNPSITWEIVQQHPEKSWNWSGLSSKPLIIKVPNSLREITKFIIKKKIQILQGEIPKHIYEELYNK